MSFAVALNTGGRFEGAIFAVFFVVCTETDHALVWEFENAGRRLRIWLPMVRCLTQESRLVPADRLPVLARDPDLITGESLTSAD